MSVGKNDEAHSRHLTPRNVTPLWFGEFELDQERRQLLRSGQPVPLEPKAYELLTLLVERRPKALSRTLAHIRQRDPHPRGGPAAP